MMKTKSNTPSHSSQNISRRSVLIGSSAAVSSFMFLPRYVLGGNEHTPQRKLNVAIIGTGGRGTQNMKELIRLKDVHVMAVCDVMEHADYSRFYYGGIAGRKPAKEIVDIRYSSEESTKDYPECKEYIDFREMLDKEQGIDAVVVATPDHNHPIACLDAIRRGKHVYCEKPLARTVYECRKITEAAREMGVATQLGNQGHSGEGIRSTVEWIRDGVIGEIREAVSPHNGGTHVGRRTERPEGVPVPEGLDWDRWLGPARNAPIIPTTLLHRAAGGISEPARWEISSAITRTPPSGHSNWVTPSAWRQPSTAIPGKLLLKPLWHTLNSPNEAICLPSD